MTPPLRAPTPKLSTLVATGLLTAILSLGGCGGDAPILNAVGSYSDVAILTDLEHFNSVAFQLKKVLEVDPQYALREERLLKVDIFDMSKKDRARVYKNVIVLGLRGGHDAASKEIRRKLGGQTMKVMDSRGLFFTVKEDVYAGNQNVLFLAGEDRNYMQSAVLDSGPALRGQIETRNRERIRDYLFSQGRDTEAEARLTRQAGFQIAIPDGYRLNGVKQNEEGTMGMAEVVANRPTRSVVVFWREVDPSKVDLEDQEELLSLRRRWAGFLDESLQDAFGFRWEMEMFRGEEWPELSGMYTTDEGDYGGPFRTIFLLDVSSGRLYGINWLCYFPNNDKHPFMREARTVAETFVPRP